MAGSWVRLFRGLPDYLALRSPESSEKVILKRWTYISVEGSRVSDLGCLRAGTHASWGHTVLVMHAVLG